MEKKIREHVIKNSREKMVLKPSSDLIRSTSSHEYHGGKIQITRQQLESGRVWKP